jgi:alanine racemase
MEVYRQTKAIIDLGAIMRNTETLIAAYPGYRYYTAVVKADCYGYRGFEVVDAMLQGGCNSLAASLLEEGLSLRARYDLPILLFTPAPLEDLQVMADQDLIATVADQHQAEIAAAVSGLKVMIRCNGGSDIFGGPTDPEGFRRLWNTLKNGRCELFGLYLHSYNAEDEADTLAEYEVFETMTRGLDLDSLPMVSISNSLTLPRYGKKPYANGCRLGNIIYRIESEDAALEHTFRLQTSVLSTFSLPAGKSVAYSHAYTAKEDCRIAAVPIGFGDGFAKMNIGRDVYIGQKRFPIVAVTMDITHILVDDSVQAGDTVWLIRDNHHLDEIAAHIHGATEEAICALNKRVRREYIR